MNKHPAAHPSFGWQLSMQITMVIIIDSHKQVKPVVDLKLGTDVNLAVVFLYQPTTLHKVTK
jgi:hypothetical protein